MPFQKAMLTTLLLASISITSSAADVKDFHLQLRKMAVELVLPAAELSQIAENELKNLVIETHGLKLEVLDLKLDFQKGIAALTSNVNANGTINLIYFSKKLVDTKASVQSEIEFEVRDWQIYAKVINLQLKTSDANLNTLISFAGPLVRTEFEKHLNAHLSHLFGAKTLRDVALEHFHNFVRDNGIEKVHEEVDIIARVTKEGLDLTINLGANTNPGT